MDGDLDEARQRFQHAITARDVALAETVLHSGFTLTLVQPVRATMPRDRWLAVLPDYIVHSYECEEEVVDVHGDLAAVLHRDRMVATVLGQDRSGTFVISDVWLREPDGWRVWRRHSTPLAAGRLPGTS